MPKSKKIVKEWKPKVNKLFKSTAKNKHSQQFGIVGTFGTGWRPYIRPYFGTSDFDLAKCMALELHEDSNYLKIRVGEIEVSKEFYAAENQKEVKNITPPELQKKLDALPLSFSAFGAVLSSVYTSKKVDDKEEKKYREVSLKKLPTPPADIFIQNDMRDIRWGTSPSTVGAIETNKDLDAARVAAVKLLLDYKLIRLQEQDYTLAEELGLRAKSAAVIEAIEI